MSRCAAVILIIYFVFVLFTMYPRVVTKKHKDPPEASRMDHETTAPHGFNL